MLRRVVLLLTASLSLLSATAQAAPSAPAQVGQHVELQPVGLPIIVRGQLVNYVFVYVRLNLSGGADTARIRAKEPFFRDALVRLAHRMPFTRADDYNKIDQARLTAALLHEAAGIAGPNAVRSIVVTSEFPRYRIATPRG